MREMDIYTIINKLGAGSYGTANLVLNNETQTKFVIKEIQLSHLNETDLQRAKEEVKVLSSLLHDHITKFQESFENNGLLYIVMEYCAGGDMQNLISKRIGVHFPEERILDWFTQLCLAVKFIHDKHIIHRDIKTQNIFLTEEGRIKLGDFGIAKMLDQTNDLANTCVGTPYYLSPEMCENKPYSNKSDVWALGCVLYEIASLHHAFEAANMKALLLKIVKCAYKPLPPKYSRDLKILIAFIFKRDPKMRPSVSSVLANKLLFKRVHRYITDKDSDDIMRKPLKKQAKTHSASHVGLHKKMGITAPSSKYGISPQYRAAYKPRSASRISYSKINKRSPSQTINSPRENKSKLFDKIVHKARKCSYGSSIQDSKLITSFKDITPKHLPMNLNNSHTKKEPLSNPAKVKLMLQDREFNMMEVSKSIYNHMGEIQSSLQNTNIKVTPYQFINFNDAKKLQSVQHLETSDFRGPLIKRVSELVDQEVFETSQTALEQRTSSYSIAKQVLGSDKCQDPQNKTTNCLEKEEKIEAYGENLICLNNIDANQLPLNETFNINHAIPCNYKTTYREMPIFSTPQKDNLDLREMLPLCRSRWNTPCTPAFAKLPLEIPASPADDTSSSDIFTCKGRKRWNQHGDDIVDILTSAKLVDQNSTLNSSRNSILCHFHHSCHQSLDMNFPNRSNTNESSLIIQHPSENDSITNGINHSSVCIGCETYPWKSANYQNCDGFNAPFSFNSEIYNIKGHFNSKLSKHPPQPFMLTHNAEIYNSKCVFGPLAEVEITDNHFVKPKSEVDCEDDSNDMTNSKEISLPENNNHFSTDGTNNLRLQEVKIAVATKDELIGKEDTDLCMSKTKFSHTSSSTDSNKSINSKKSKRGLLSFFSKSQSSDIKDVSSPSHSKAKSRFSGILKKLMPKHSKQRIERDSSFTSENEDLSTGALNCSGSNLTHDNQKSFQLSNHPIYHDSDAATDSGIQSCVSAITFSNIVQLSDETDINSEINEDSQSDKSVIHIKDFELQKLSEFDHTNLQNSLDNPIIELREKANILVENAICSAQLIMKGKTNYVAKSPEYTSPSHIHVQIAPTDLKDVTNSSEFSQIKDELDYLNVSQPTFNKSDRSKTHQYETFDMALNETAPSFRFMEGQDDLITTHVLHNLCTSEAVEPSLNANPGSVDILSDLRIEGISCSNESITKTVPVRMVVKRTLSSDSSEREDIPPFLMSNEDEGNANRDVCGWIEEQKASLEDLLGMDLFMECYRCLESSFEENDSDLTGALDLVKYKLGLERETLANKILHIITSETIYSN